MPRYFFHQRLADGAMLHDDEGSELESLESAREEAIESARELMSQRVRQGLPANNSAFEIEDEQGRVVLVLPFSEAIG
jgi:glycine cleavage system regulatory protein